MALAEDQNSPLTGSLQLPALLTPHHRTSNILFRTRRNPHPPAHLTAFAEIPLSQCAQMFNLWKHLNIILGKAVTLCCKFCRAREFALLLSDFCRHFARKEPNAGSRVTFQVCLRAEPSCPRDRAKMLHAELLLSPQPSLSVPFRVVGNTSERQAATFRCSPSAPFCPSTCSWCQCT